MAGLSTDPVLQSWWQQMGKDEMRSANDGDLEVVAAEAGLSVLLAACERAVEEIGSSIPAAQLRALLIVEHAGSMNLNQLASALDSTASAASRLADRMQAAGLLTRDRAAISRREIVLVATEAGRQLAGWVTGQRRAALGRVLGQMTAEGRAALSRGLVELSTHNPGD